MKRVISMMLVFMIFASVFSISTVTGSAAIYSNVKPNITSIKNIDGGQKLTWNNSDFVGCYRLYFGTYNANAKEFRWRRYKDIPNNTFEVTKKTLSSSGWKAYGKDRSISTPELTSGTCYCYQIQAKTNGKYSSVKTMTYVSVPSVSCKSDSTSGVKVSWNTVKGANYYKIAYRVKGTTSYTYINDIKSTSYKIRNTKLKSKQIEIRVQAYYKTAKNGTAYSAWSKINTAKHK